MRGSAGCCLIGLCVESVCACMFVCVGRGFAATTKMRDGGLQNDGGLGGS